MTGEPIPGEVPKTPEVVTPEPRKPADRRGQETADIAVNEALGTNAQKTASTYGFEAGFEKLANKDSSETSEPIGTTGASPAETAPPRTNPDILEPEYTSLYGRLLLATQLPDKAPGFLNPDWRVITLPTFDPNLARDYSPITHELSTKERRYAWEGVDFNVAKEQWKTKLTASINATADTNKGRLDAIQLISGKTAADFKIDDAEALYIRFCKGKSDTTAFIRATVEGLRRDQDGKVDPQRIEVVKPHVEWIAFKLFGKQTASVVARMVELEASMSNDSDTTVKTVYEISRINNLNDAGEGLLAPVYESLIETPSGDITATAPARKTNLVKISGLPEVERFIQDEIGSREGSMQTLLSAVRRIQGQEDSSASLEPINLNQMIRGKRHFIPIVASMVANRRDPTIPVVKPTFEDAARVSHRLQTMSRVMRLFSGRLANKFEGFVARKAGERAEETAQNIVNLIEVLSNTPDLHKQFLKEVQGSHDIISRGNPDRATSLRNFLFRLKKKSSPLKIGLPLLTSIIKFKPELAYDSQGKQAEATPEILKGMESFLQNKGWDTTAHSTRYSGSFTRGLAEMFASDRLELVRTETPIVLDAVYDMIPYSGPAYAQKLQGLFEKLATPSVTTNAEQMPQQNTGLVISTW